MTAESEVQGSTKDGAGEARKSDEAHAAQEGVAAAPLDHRSTAGACDLRMLRLSSSAWALRACTVYAFPHNRVQVDTREIPLCLKRTTHLGQRDNASR